MSKESTGTSAGCIGVGNVLAFIISWKLWHSLAWALLATIFGWLYVFYAFIYYLTQITTWLS